MAPAIPGLQGMRHIGHDAGDKAIPAGCCSPTMTVTVKACGKDSDGRAMVVAISYGSGVVVRPCTTVCVPGESYCTQQLKSNLR